MKLQLVCIAALLLVSASKTLCAFKIQTDVASSETHQEGTSGLQVLLRRTKRHNSHFPICTYCCSCCKNKDCGFCCRT